MKKLVEREYVFQKFLEARKLLNASLDNAGPKSFIQLFQTYKAKAGKGDIVAQDVVAYYYKNGVPRFLYEDFTKYLKWEILSGANGNTFAIEKLQFLFGYAYDSIVSHEDFALIKYLNNIDEYNYIGIIGQFICIKLVEKLDLDEKKLASEKDEGDNFRPETFRDFRKAIDESVVDVIKFMKQKS